MTIIVPTFNERDNVAPLVARLGSALPDVNWQVIFVDDDSPDATADAVRELGREAPHISCIRRIGRRGLAGAVIEGALASSAPFIAVIDGDQQHDERILPVMLDRLRADESDLVIGSRFLQTEIAEGLSEPRNQASRMTNRVVNRVLGTKLTDPLSGCFMMRREWLDRVAHRLYPQGFKILIDLIGAMQEPVRISEAPLNFRKRVSGTSKLDTRIVLDFVCVLLRRLTGMAIPSWFVPALLTGFVAIPAHILLLGAMLDAYGPVLANLVGALVAMSFSYWLGNALTYRDRQYRGWKWLWGWLRHAMLSLPGLGMNMAVAVACTELATPWILAGLAAALAGLIWNTLIVAQK